jgi:spermidine/putrescine transport system ATP-binding protein
LQQDLEVDRVSKRYGAHAAVDALSLTVAHGSFFSILGPSGCGKTTLLRIVAGFLAPDDGEVRIGGASMRGVPPNRRPVNMVFQHLALFPMMTVGDNVGYGLARRGVARAEIASRVDAMLKRVGLPGAQAKRIDQLSGGQKQRVAIARSLVLEPALLLLDEPLGALDLKLREHMKIELKQLQADFGTTFVYITHDQSEALVLSDHVAVMNAGRFEQVGTPQALYYDPQTRSSRGSSARTTGIAGRAARVDGDVVEVATPEGLGVRARRAERSLPAMRSRRSSVPRRSISRATPPSFRPPRSDSRGAWRACCSTARTRPSFCARHARTPRYGSRCRRPGASPTSPSARRSPSRSTRDARCASARARAMVSAASDPLASRARLTMLLLLAPAAVWLIGLIVLPHVELAVLSLRERVAPRVYEWGFAQYRTFFDEPLYWRTFVRTATMSIVATACTLAIAFPVAWYIAKIARGRAKSLLFVLCLIPFWVSETVRTLGWMILLRESGVLPRLLVDLGSPRRPSRCSITTRRSWSASSTRRCCSWSCRSSACSRASTTR